VFVMVWLDSGWDGCLDGEVGGGDAWVGGVDCRCVWSSDEFWLRDTPPLSGTSYLLLWLYDVAVVYVYVDVGLRRR